MEGWLGGDRRFFGEVSQSRPQMPRPRQGVRLPTQATLDEAPGRRPEARDGAVSGASKS